MFDNWTWYLGFFNNISDFLIINSLFVLVAGAVLAKSFLHVSDLPDKHNPGFRIMILGSFGWIMGTIIGIF